MIIECPFCHTRAKIADSKEGAKVRCGECGKIYAAREPGARGKRSSQSNPLPIILTVCGVLLLAGVMYVANSGDDTAEASNVEAPEEPDRGRLKDESGWSSEIVQYVCTIHDAAWLRESARLEGMIAFPRVWERLQTPAAGEDAEQVLDPTPWAELDDKARREFQREVIASLTTGYDKEEFADWKPFDGLVVLEDATEAIVRVTVAHRDPTTNSETRHVEWSLVKDGLRWKAWNWERWYSDAEKKAQRVRRSRITQKRTLSDGSVVIEAEPKPLEHFEDTPPELRATIDATYATMIDLTLRPPENARAKADLVAIGKPALPVLLTGLYTIPLDTEEQAIQVNLINQALEEITGFYTGYKPQVNEGSGVGTTHERRDSAIKQWFGWWYRKGKKFEENQETDLLEEEADFENMTEREKREYEKYKRQIEEEQRAEERRKP